MESGNESLPQPRWQRLLAQLSELFEKTGDPIARRATAVALLHHKVPGVSWTGFYMLTQGKLIVNVYQGPVACLSLQPHSGVCWAAIDQGRSLIVSDVDSFPGHIPCDSRTRSEIVLPFRDPGGKICGVLDVDSYHPDHFDNEHRIGYQAVLQLLEAT